MAIVKIWFSGKPYTYEFNKPKDNTDSALAMAISQAMWEKEHKRKLTKFSGAPQHYNLLMELLSRKRSIYTHESGKIDYFVEASRRSSEEKHVFDEKTQRWIVPSWRVGKTFSNRVTIEIDDSSIVNLRFVCGCYEVILNTKFEAIKTNKGYWLISTQTVDKEEFVYQHAKILNPSLKRTELKAFLKALSDLDYDDKGNWIKASPEKILSLSGVNPRGNIDILFTLLSIKREQSTLRISKKHKNDKLEEVKL